MRTRFEASTQKKERLARTTYDRMELHVSEIHHMACEHFGKANWQIWHATNRTNET